MVVSCDFTVVQVLTYLRGGFRLFPREGQGVRGVLGDHRRVTVQLMSALGNIGRDIDGIAHIDGFVQHSYNVVKWHVKGRSPAPVVKYFKDKAFTVRDIGNGCDADIIGRADAQVVAISFCSPVLSFRIELRRGRCAKESVKDVVQTVHPSRPEHLFFPVHDAFQESSNRCGKLPVPTSLAGIRGHWIHVTGNDSVSADGFNDIGPFTSRGSPQVAFQTHVALRPVVQGMGQDEGLGECGVLRRIGDSFLPDYFRLDERNA